MISNFEGVSVEAKYLVEALWNNYRSKVKDVVVVSNLFESKREEWYLDHFALRTLSKHQFKLIISIFESIGYSKQDRYIFESKKLEALWLKPTLSSPLDKDVLPKIFISRLCLELFDKDVQNCLEDYLSTDWTLRKPVVGNLDNTYSLLLGGVSWIRPSLTDYKFLQNVSEYAAWTLAWGGMVNHFAFACQQFKSFVNLKDVNNHLKQMGLVLNSSGGEIKGDSTFGLQQSSTMATIQPYLFKDQQSSIPSSFVEFSWRYPSNKNTDSTRWDYYYQGFVTSNADKIFESTDSR